MTKRTPKSRFLEPWVVGLLFSLIAFLSGAHAYGALGDVAATYTFPASAFAMSPTGPYMYATIPSQNSVAIINTSTLTYETVIVGSSPSNLALSPDGLTAYIANSGSSFVVVFDTQSRMVTHSFLIPEQPRDVVLANQNRLFVLTENHIYQIDATTGASTGPSIGGASVDIYGGSLEISPDRNTLYYGQQGLSPSSMYKINISGTTAMVLQETDTGENGHDITLSHDGNSICHPNGAPYVIAKYRTSDFATLGSFDTGAYPEAMGFSPDDLVAYASVDSQGGIKVFDANTFLSMGMITGPDTADSLAIDSSSRYLFAGYAESFGDFMGTKVYDTGRGGPTPTPAPTPTPCPLCTPTPTPAPPPTPTPAAFGEVVATYSFPASAFAISPTQPNIMYAAVPSQNSIAIIDTNTLTYETVPVGSGPANLAFSPDGSKVYIANSQSSFVVVFDTQTRTVTSSFLIPEQPRDVVFANQNRLFILTENNIYQIDATTGASSGPGINAFYIYSGSLEISPDRNTLYYGQYGLSPTTMYKFDISGTTPALLLQTETGSNGEDLTLSHDGNSICHPNGAPYQIAKYRTSDFATLGSFNTGAYPTALGFSADDLVAYASVDSEGGIKVFDANTFAGLGMITGPDVATKLAVDSANRYLFAGYTAYFGSFMGTKVYATGRGGPTPTPAPTPTPCPICTPTPTPTAPPTPTPGNFGEVAATFSFPASSLVMSPTQSYMYATVPSQNSVAIIDTNTLTYETVPVGSGPSNLALSPDGLTAYITNSGSSFVVVFDTQTRTVTHSFPISETPRDVVFGNQNRLFVLGDDHIIQIDATTGASTGPSIGFPTVDVYSGSLEISPDRNTLYYGQYGLSPTTMFKLNISGTTLALLSQTETGSNGEDLTISHDGNSICHPNGAPYQIAKYRTSDLATLGSFVTGPYPVSVGFSPDDSVAYASVYSEGGIQVFDANTFVQTGMISGPEVATKVTVDSTGKYLFAGYSGFITNFMGTKVYFTGRGGPTPTPCPLCTPTPTPTPGAQVTHLMNLSTRMRVETENNVAIGGFIITGTAPRQVLLRGIGPSLTTQGVPGALVDPVMELHGTGSFTTITNENWKDTQQVEITATGIPPANDLESAILATLAPGAYTAILRGNDNGTGVGLMEMYDLDQGNESKLANISTRAFVGTGTDIVIAGFILGGGTNDERILIRGLGPSLGQSGGVPDALSNPRMELRNGEGVIVTSNDDWQDGPPVSLPPSDASESAIELTLSPGAYTALLSGVDNSTGVGLIEVYDLGPP